MSTRAAAFAMLLVSLVLIATSVADWAIVDVTQTFEGAEDVAVITQGEPVNGTELAGGLLTVGLLGVVVAAVQARVRRAALLAIPLAAAGAVLLIDGWPREGSPTASPSLAAAALVAMVAVPAVVLLRPPARPGPDEGPVTAPLPGATSVTAGDSPPPAHAPSRYTVEAARGDVEDPLDEWELAVADVAPPPAQHEDDVRPHPPLDATTPHTGIDARTPHTGTGRP